MGEQLPEVWLDALRAWAETEPLVVEAYIFGSRAKGISGSDSDLDVALKIAGATESERYGNWICLGDTMRNSLGALLPVALDLQAIHDDDEVVGPAVRDHGILVFHRDS
ncbi:MAG: nucleotidyltransferase domain-containing protein [Proteobacteria bacterium]|nr:nucleotidyltransferase domain-containing protein [Pseudomonadota bacterium]